MSNFIAKSILVNNGRNAYIILYSDTEWVDLNWETTIVEYEFYNKYVPLFTFKQSGIGILKNSKTLSIFLENVPLGLFSLKTSQGTKNFKLIDETVKLPSIWTSVNSFALKNNLTESGGGKSYNGPGLIYLSNKYNEDFEARQYGILFSNNKVKRGIFWGDGFGSFEQSSSSATWPYAGVLFHTIIWYNYSPVNEEEFIFKTNIKGTTSNYQEVKIILNNNHISSPVDPFYNLNNKIFHIKRTNNELVW